MFSFTARKKTIDFQKYIRRLIDVTRPNAGLTSAHRSENRHNRAIPVLLCAWKDDAPIVSEAVVAVSKDITDSGIGVILPSSYSAANVVVGFCQYDATAEQPWFFRGEVQHQLPIGGGFWLLGIRLSEFMNEDWSDQLSPLVPMARALLQPA